MTTRAVREPDAGSALLMALLVSTLLCGLGLGLVLVGDTETLVASNFRAGTEAMYAADAALELVTSEVGRVARWTDVLTGVVTSGLVDTTLHPVLPSNVQIDLTTLTSQLQGTSDAAVALGANSPRWRLFAYGLVSQLASPSPLTNQAYVAVWLADDLAEIDGDPWTDTNGVVMTMARAMAPGGAVRTIAATLAHPNPGSGSLSDVRLVSWREVR
jgi:hypothetical protein